MNRISGMKNGWCTIGKEDAHRLAAVLNSAYWVFL